MCVCWAGSSRGSWGAVWRRCPFFWRDQEVAGPLRGGESQLLPGVSRWPGGESRRKTDQHREAPKTPLSLSVLLLWSLNRLSLKGFLRARSCCRQGAPFSPQRRSTWRRWTSVSLMTPVRKSNANTIQNSTALLLNTKKVKLDKIFWRSASPRSGKNNYYKSKTWTRKIKINTIKIKTYSCLSGLL